MLLLASDLKRMIQVWVFKVCLPRPSRHQALLVLQMKRKGSVNAFVSSRRVGSMMTVCGLFVFHRDNKVDKVNSSECES